MTIFSSELLGWNFLSSRFFIGTYYGILATLPLAPSQLLSIRVLLLEDENKQGKMAGSGAAKGIFIGGVSGFLIAQFAIFLSIYCFPLYQLWFKPHLFNLLLPPFLLWHYFKIIEFDPVAHLIPNYQYPLFDPRVRTAFIESFVLQIINPIVLPNPVFTRLMSIFLFRYSNIPIFVFGSLIGWFSGQLLFVKLSSMLLSRLQLDSPAIYRIVKRIVHWAFPPIIMGILLSYMGRVSIEIFDYKFDRKKISPYRVWPDICYNRSIVSSVTHFMISPHRSSPFRNKTNTPFNSLNAAPHKDNFSQYFFQTCVSDGKQRLSHNYPISISLIQNDLNDMMKLSENKYMLKKDWFKDKEIRLLRFNHMMNKKFHHLDKRLHSIDEHGLKKFNLSKYFNNKYFNNNSTYSNEFSKGIRIYIQSNYLTGNHIKKKYDIRLGNTLRQQPNLEQNQSPWLSNRKVYNDIYSGKRRNWITRWKINDKRLNRLKRMISKLNINHFYFDLYKVFPVWKSYSEFGSFHYILAFIRKNVKRGIRSNLFMRSVDPEANWTLSANNDGILFQFLGSKPRSSFFLRAQEIIIDSKDNFNLEQRVSQTEAENFDFSASHSVRGPALITQAFIRKYIKLPILIFGKSLVRLVLMHTSEWNQDWTEWSKEKYVYCYYNGNDVLGNQMPTHWLGDGLQIKILSPFYLTPWRPSLYNKYTLLETKNPLLRKSSYINIWGQETDVPFGEIQYTPFLKPLVKGFIIFSRYQLGRILRIINQIWFTFHKQYSFVQSQFDKKIRTFDKQTSRNTFDFEKNDIKSSLETQIISDKSNYLPHNLKNQNQNMFLIETDVKKHPISEEKIYIQNLNKSKTKIQINQEIENINAVSLTQNIISSSRLIGVNNDEFIYKDHYSLMKQSIRYNQLPVFPNTFIFQKMKKFFEYQIIKIRIVFLRLYQILVYTRKSIFRKIMNLIRIYQIRMFQHKRDIIFVLTKIISKKKNVIILLNNKTLLPGKLNNYEDSLSDSLNYVKEDTNLSHAYILHKIWQNNFPNRLPIQKICINWEANNILNNNIKMALDENGFFQTNEYGCLPKNVQYPKFDKFKEWLRPFRRYNPSPEIWNQICPNNWRASVFSHWAKNYFVADSFNIKKKVYKNKSSLYLSYFEPLFEKSKKMTKRWQVNLLINSYTNALKNDVLDDLLKGWQTQNRENIQNFHRHLMYNELHPKVDELIPKFIGFTGSRFRINDHIISCAYMKPWRRKYQLKPRKLIFNKQPIYIKYKTTSRRAQNKNPFFAFRQRVSFAPMIQYKWKSKKDRFKALDNINIISQVKSDLKNAIKMAVLSRKNKVKSLATFETKIKELKLQWKTLTPLTSKTISKRQAKLVDDEMFMHTIVSSFLTFKNKYLKFKNLVFLNSSLNKLFLTDTFLPKYSLIKPEGLLLAKTLREYRILSSFQFISQNQIDQINKMQNLSKLKKLKRRNNIGFESWSHPSLFKTSQEFYSHHIIKCYLWPSYRVEDLACMNRYWINTTNQSRFSNLTIRIYPNLHR